jgi:hypothetical protein
VSLGAADALLTPSDDFGRLLHHHYPTLPVLYMSGYSKPDFDFIPSADLGRCWLQKPFDVSALVEMALELCEPAQRAP